MDPSAFRMDDSLIEFGVVRRSACAYCCMGFRLVLERSGAPRVDAFMPNRSL